MKNKGKSKKPILIITVTASALIILWSATAAFLSTSPTLDTPMPQDESDGSSESNKGAAAEHNYSKGLEYAPCDNGNAYTLIGVGRCKDGDIVIPPTYKDLPVISVADKAFEGNYRVRSVTFSKNIQSIGEFAFYGCSLTSLTVPDNITSVGCYAFMSCKSLKEVQLGNGLEKLSGGMFSYCESLNQIAIPSSVTQLGHVASKGENSSPVGPFFMCTSLEKIVIPSSVKRIGRYAFEGCGALKEVIIEDGVEQIHHGAFVGCTSLKALNLPHSITVAYANAFDRSYLQSIKYNGMKKEFIELIHECPINAGFNVSCTDGILYL